MFSEWLYISFYRSNTICVCSYIPRMNGFGGNGGMETRPAQLSSPVRADTVDVALGGLFTGLAKKQGGPHRLPAFPESLDMTSTKVIRYY